MIENFFFSNLKQFIFLSILLHLNLKVKLIKILKFTSKRSLKARFKKQEIIKKFQLFYLKKNITKYKSIDFFYKTKIFLKNDKISIM